MPTPGADLRVADATTSATSAPSPSRRSAGHRADRKTAHASPAPPRQTNQHRRRAWSSPDGPGRCRERSMPPRPEPSATSPAGPRSASPSDGGGGRIHDQPGRGAEHGQGTDAPGRKRIDVNNNAFTRTEPRYDIDPRSVYTHLPMR